ncbi:MAG: hypothetical protein GF310_03790 [candidate division Zixibacteria bacterium]|nr:hypothetical protein [candidate division Zixibacteria bacterium]
MRKAFVFCGVFFLLLLLVCSEDTTGPDENDFVHPITIQACFDLQDSIAQSLLNWLDVTDTTAALNSTRRLLLEAEDLVDTAYVHSQGIAIEFKTGMRGGIMIDALDGLPLVAEDAPPNASPAPEPKVVETRPGSLRALLLCPIYLERREIVDSLIESMGSDLARAGYGTFIKRLGNICTISHFNDLEGFGIIHIYSHGFVWPDDESHEEVYLMSSESAERLNRDYEDELLDGRLAPIYIPGRGNLYFIGSSYISAQNNLENSSPLVCFSFRNGINSNWTEKFYTELNAGACVGVDGPLKADQNLEWSSGIYAALTDTSEEITTTLSEWRNSIDAEYDYDDDIITRIDYAGPDDFIIWKRVHIDNLSRYSGKPEDIVEIRGFGFGMPELGGRAFFGNTEAEIVSWSDTLIETRVPEEALTDSVAVRVGNSLSNKMLFRVHPTLGISGIFPDSATLGDTVEIIGGGFGGTSSTLEFGGSPANSIVFWSDTLIIAEVPISGRPTDSYVRVLGPEDWTGGFDFRLLPMARLYEISPMRGKYNDTLEFHGRDFGAYSDDKIVYFAGWNGFVGAEIEEWADTLVKALVPDSAISGQAFIQLNDWTGSRSDILSVEVFGIADLESPYVLPAHVVELIGTGFGNTQGSSGLFLDTTELGARTWSDERITATIPLSAQSGDLYVSVNGDYSNPRHVNVPRYESITPFWVLPGDPVYIHGRGFGEINQHVYFPIGVDGIIESWTDTLITAVTPEGARSGQLTLQFGDLELPISDIDVFHVDRISPNTGLPGRLISIHGSGFLPVEGDSYVTFGDIEAEVSDWSDSLIRVYVPQIEQDCPVRIHIYDYVSPGIEFEVQDLPDIQELLDQTKYFVISFEGVVVWEMNPERSDTLFDRFYVFEYKLENTWATDTFKFGYFCEDLIYCYCLAANGWMSEDRLSVAESFSQYHNFIDEAMMNEITVMNHEFKFTDVPLSQYEYHEHGDTIKVIYELTGPDVENHISEILIYKDWYYYDDGPPDPSPTSPSEGHDIEVVDVDWQNAVHPPKIRIVFSNYAYNLSK